MKKSKYEYPVPEHQADAYLSQANPVSATRYTVLDTTKNVRIISITAMVTWATTQPTPLKVYVTIDGQSIVHYKSDPVSAVQHEARFTASALPTSQPLVDVATSDGPFRYEGRSVKVEVEITWAVTQPTPLVCRVKYAKW